MQSSAVSNFTFLEEENMPWVPSDAWEPPHFALQYVFPLLVCTQRRCAAHLGSWSVWLHVLPSGAVRLQPRLQSCCNQLARQPSLPIAADTPKASQLLAVDLYFAFAMSGDASACTGRSNILQGARPFCH